MTIYTSKKFYSEVLSAKISPRKEEPVFQKQKGTWPFEKKSSRELLCRHRPPHLLPPVFSRCPKSGASGCSPPPPHSVVEGSFFTRLCARMEDSMGFSWGLGLELFSAEYVAAIAPFTS